MPERMEEGMCRNTNQGILAVIIAHNECKCVKINVKILLDELKGTGSEVLVVDNHSDDGLQEWLAAQEGISYMLSDRTEGYGTILQAIRKEFGEQRNLLLLRANYFFTPGSILDMKDVLEQDENLAAAGPVSNGLTGEQKCRQAATYERAQDIRNAGMQAGAVRTARLDADVLMLKGSTLAWFDEEIQIPGAAVRAYQKKALEQGASFAVVKNAVCFAVCKTEDAPYRAFCPKLYQEAQLQQLLYSFGDAAYKGVHLYKYLEPDILVGINEQNHWQNTERNRGIHMWQTDQVAVSTKEEADAVCDMIGSLPQKDVLFVTLLLRRMYQGQLAHTVMESYMASLEEEKYLDLEYVVSMENDALPIPTKNRYPVLITAIPKMYGLEEVNQQELLDFLWVNFIHPLETVLDICFEQDLLRECLRKASYILQERNGYIRFYREVLKKVQPKVIIYSHGQDRLLTYLRDTALEQGIPTLEVAHGVTASGAYHKHLAYADYLIAHSEVVAEKSRLAGNDRVLAVGKPGVYEALKIREQADRKIVISFISSLECEIYGYARHLAERLNKEDYIVFYKYHTAEMWDRQEMQEVEKALGNFQFADGVLDIRNLVQISDIVVGIRSTGIFDALPYPFVKIIAMKEKATIYGVEKLEEVLQDLVDHGEIVMAENEEQLYEEVVHYKPNTMYRKIPNHFLPVDAKERFLKLVEGYL